MGYPTVFIRTTGCHLRCTYCDTQYAYHEGHFKSLEQILQEVETYPARHICVTGGEPLLQREVLPLMEQLCNRGYTVSLETSGGKSIHGVDPRVHLILDVKTPDSGAANSFDFENLSQVTAKTEFKFVICSEEDFTWSEEFCRQHELFGKFAVLYSPSFNRIEPRWLAEKILQEKSPARLQLQLHKYIWSPETRGV